MGTNQCQILTRHNFVYFMPIFGRVKQYRVYSLFHEYCAVLQAAEQQSQSLNVWQAFFSTQQLLSEMGRELEGGGRLIPLNCLCKQ